MSCTDPVFGLELPVHGQAVVHDDSPVAPQHPGLVDGVAPPRHRGVDQRVETGGDHVHPAVLGADAVAGLIGVQHRQRAQQRHQGGDEAAQAPGGVVVDGVDGPGGDGDAEQVGHRLGHPAVGDVLAAEQVGHHRPHPGPVGHRGAHRGREGSRGGPATRAAAGMGAVLGHHRCDLGQVDDLAGREAGRGVLVQLRPASLAAGRPVVDHRVRVGRHLQGRALRPSLLALLALRSFRRRLALLALLGLALAFGGGVPRRRLAGVPRVLARLALQLGHPGLEPFVRLAQRLDRLRLCRDRGSLLRHQGHQLGHLALVAGNQRGIVWHGTTFATPPRDSCLRTRFSFRRPVSPGQAPEQLRTITLG